MEKRLSLAIALSLLVLIAWSMLVPKPQTAVRQDVTTSAPEINPQPAAPSPLPINESLMEPGPTVVFSQPDFEVFFDEQQAAIKEVVFKNYKDYKFILDDAFRLDIKGQHFKKVLSNYTSITFVQSDATKKIVKRFIFDNSNYSIKLEINVQNNSNVSLDNSLKLHLGRLDFHPNNPGGQYQDVAVGTSERTLHVSGKKSASFAQAKFLALRERYFSLIAQPEKSNCDAVIAAAPNQPTEVAMLLPEETIAPGGQIGHFVQIYLGPLNNKYINKVNPDWTFIVHYGVFDIVAQVILQLLDLLFRLTHNWGWAIVLLSLIVYFVLFPLSLKQMRSMKDMQALQPHIEALRKAYKDNPQKLNMEIMNLYKEHKVNPLGGCLPMLLQLPIFFALYQVLMRSVSLRGAHFMWIKDLSEPDKLFTLPFTLPVLSNEFNILPILMAIGMFVQQKMSSLATSASAAEQQKIMLIVMPVMFGVIFYRMPAGLVLYWFINSAMMLFFQLRMNRGK